MKSPGKKHRLSWCRVSENSAMAAGHSRNCVSSQVKSLISQSATLLFFVMSQVIKTGTRVPISDQRKALTLYMHLHPASLFIS